MNGPASRRGFLRGLTTLPLIGGGLTLIGSPSAVAEPVTDALFDAYVAFVCHEHREVLAEHSYRRAQVRMAQLAAEGRASLPGFAESVAQDTREQPYLFWVPKGHDRIAGTVNAAPSSTRAALVLSAVGCDWRGGAA